MLTSLSSTIANEFLFKYEQCDRAAQKSSKYYLTVCDLMPVRCCCLSVCVIFSDFVGKAKCVQYMYIFSGYLLPSCHTLKSRPMLNESRTSNERKTHKTKQNKIHTAHRMASEWASEQTKEHRERKKSVFITMFIGTSWCRSARLSAQCVSVQHCTGSHLCLYSTINTHT